MGFTEDHLPTLADERPARTQYRSLHLASCLACFAGLSEGRPAWQAVLEVMLPLSEQGVRQVETLMETGDHVVEARPAADCSASTVPGALPSELGDPSRHPATVPAAAVVTYGHDEHAPERTTA